MNRINKPVTLYSRKRGRGRVFSEINTKSQRNAHTSTPSSHTGLGSQRRRRWSRPWRARTAHVFRAFQSACARSLPSALGNFYRRGRGEPRRRSISRPLACPARPRPRVLRVPASAADFRLIVIPALTVIPTLIVIPAKAGTQAFFSLTLRLFPVGKKRVPVIPTQKAAIHRLTPRNRAPSRHRGWLRHRNQLPCPERLQRRQHLLHCRLDERGRRLGLPPHSPPHHPRQQPECAAPPPPAAVRAQFRQHRLAEAPPAVGQVGGGGNGVHGQVFLSLWLTLPR